MKTLSLLIALFSTTAFASFNDFECNFQGQNGEQIKVEVERSYSPGMKRINLTQTTDQSVDRFTYFTSARIDNMNRIQYWGGGIDLEIDLWPDHRPQYGRFYRSEFRSMDINDGRAFYNIYCQFTGF